MQDDRRLTLVPWDKRLFALCASSLEDSRSPVWKKEAREQEKAFKERKKEMEKEKGIRYRADIRQDIYLDIPPPAGNSGPN